jgi:dienelactone hydrolase
MCYNGTSPQYPRSPIELTPSPSRDIRFEISPNPAFMDEDVRIRVLGASPNQTIRIRATTQDDDQRRWTSHAEFRADPSGFIDVASAPSFAGTYRGVSPMGLFWSMQLADKHSNERAIFAKKSTSPNIVRLEAESAGRVIAFENFQRNLLAPGSETRDLNIAAQQSDSVPSDAPDSCNFLVAHLFLPSTKAHAPHPLVIVLGGSGGGFDLDKAAVLSRHGFATLAVAYFGTPPLPAWLHRIPLDYFEAALAWLTAQPEIDIQRIGVLGVSRGAELALLLASTFPQIRSVVAYAPSSVAWAAAGRDKSTGEIIPSWTWRGEPVPFAPLPLRGFMLRSAIPVVLLRRPVVFRNLFRAGLRNRATIERAAIPVEKIGGPILLISGGDDHLWPAAQMSEAILARLKRHGFPHAAEHLHYPRAGHMLRYPFLPTTSRESRNPHLRNAKFSFGGTAPADAEAQTDSWRRAIAFLQAHL